MRPEAATTNLAAAMAAASGVIEFPLLEQHPIGDSVAVAVTCCQSLVDQGLAVLYPGSEAYTQREESYWSVAAQLSPWCIVQPSDAQEVATALTTLLANAECGIAIRGAGHTGWPGANNIANGATIDLGNMNATIYHAGNSTASILPGTRWLQAYQTLDALHVTVPGGRAGTVGVSGLILGGGVSFHSAKTGMVCDNILGYEMVTAEGEIIYVTKDRYTDLFTALKGGLSNFGIVTRFDMAAFKARQIWGGVVVYPTTAADELLDAMVDFADKVENDPGSASIIFWSHLSPIQGTVVIAAFENTDGVVKAPSFEKYFAIKGSLSSTMRLTNVSDLTHELEQSWGYHDIWFTLTFKNDKRVLEYAVQTHDKLVEELKELFPDGDFITQCMFQPLPTLFAKHSAERGGNVLGLDKVTENGILWLATLAVKGPERAAVAHAKMTAWVANVESYSKSIDGLIDFKYLNYADPSQDPMATYGAENLANIKAAAEKYDPNGVFQSRIPGGFKISKVGSI